MVVNPIVFAASETAQLKTHEDCAGVIRYIMDVLISAKAAYLIIMSVKGINGWKNARFGRFQVIFLLVLGIVIVSNEFFIRFGERDIRFRFSQQLISQWMCFATLTVMLKFARRSQAAKASLRFYIVFIPIHFGYLTLFFIGLDKTYGAYCDAFPYPVLFLVQQIYFFSVWAVYKYISSMNYCLVWDPQSDYTTFADTHPIDEYQDHDQVQVLADAHGINTAGSHESTLGDSQDTVQRLVDDADVNFRKQKARLIFEQQAKRLKQHYNWVLQLLLIQCGISMYLTAFNGNDTAVKCADDGTHWMFTSCGSCLTLYITHTMVTMQTASVVRVVFIKVVQNVWETDEFKAVSEAQRQFHDRVNMQADHEDDLQLSNRMT